MTPVNGDFDQMLRRALHAAADSIEPADGGLELIRHRMRAPWLVRQTSLMLTECVDLARLIGIRLEPGFTSARAAIAARGGSWGASLTRLSSQVPVLATIGTLLAPSRHRAAAHRGRADVGSNLAWLRPALAVAGAVVIVVAGVYGLAQVRHNLVLELFPGSSTPASTGSNTSRVPTLQGQSAPGVIPPPSTRTGSASPSPKASCSPTPAQQATPTPTPTTSSPTPSVVPSDSPTPVPTDSLNPTPTASTVSSVLPANAAASVQIAAGATATASQCGQAGTAGPTSPGNIAPAG